MTLLVNFWFHEGVGGETNFSVGSLISFEELIRLIVIGIENHVKH